MAGIGTLTAFLGDLNWVRVTVVISLGLVSLPLYRVLYNLFFHPLAKFPGPRLWAISRFPYVVALRGGELVRVTKKLHDEYGPIVRIAPNELAFTDPQASRDIYGFRHGHKPFPKNPLWIPIPPKNGPRAPSILNADDEDHQRIRKAWSFGFSDKSLKDQEYLIRGHVDLLVAQLKKQIDRGHGSADVDMVKWFNYCAFDIVGDLTFGESFGCLAEDRYHEWVSNIVHHFIANKMVIAARYFPRLSKIMMWTAPQKGSLERQKNHNLMTKEKVKRRMENTDPRPDFISHLTRSREGLSYAEIESTAGIIIIAGSNSLTTTYSGTINYLLRFPEALRKVTQEVRGAFSLEEEITITSLDQLPYLAAVVEEGLRIISPVPLGMPRVVPKGGDTICGHFLPEDTNVSYMQYAASTSKLNFKDPDDFHPERWLPNGTCSESPFKDDRRDAVNVFSLGPRSCLGRKLAYFELKLVLARILYNFDLSLPQGPGSGLIWTTQKTYTTWVKEPFIVRIKRSSKVRT